MLGKKKTFLWACLVLTFFVAYFTAAVSPAGERTMDFYAIHRQTKEPLQDVALTIRVTTGNHKRRESWEYKTDSQGLCRIKLPDFQIETLRLYPKKEGFVPLFILWRGIPTPVLTVNYIPA